MFRVPLALLTVVAGAAAARAAPAASDALMQPVLHASPDAAVPARDVVIPTNARLLAFSDGGDVSFDRVRADGSHETLVVDKHSSAISHTLLVALGDLAPGDAVVVQPSCDGCNDVFTWTVGDGPDDDPPVFGADGRQRFRATPVAGASGPFTTTTGYTVTGCLPRASDANGLVLHVVVDGGEEGFLPLGGGSPTCGTPLSFRITGGAPRTACFTAGAVDVSGNEAALDPVCVELGDADLGGCSSTGANGGAMLTLVFLLGCRRRASCPRAGGHGAPV